MGRVQLKCDGTRWRREGKWRRNWRMVWVASTLHTTSQHGAASITTADAHTSAANSRQNWRPRRFKWTRPSRRKTKSGSCACAITFQTQSTWITSAADTKQLREPRINQPSLFVPLFSTFLLDARDHSWFLQQVDEDENIRNRNRKVGGGGGGYLLRVIPSSFCMPSCRSRGRG